MKNNFLKKNMNKTIIPISIIIFLALTIGVLGYCFNITAKKKITVPPNTEQVMGYLFDNLEVKFPPGQACAGNDGTTVGNYLKTTLAFLAKEESESSWSRVNCDRVKLDNNLVEFYSNGRIFPKRVVAALREIEPGEILYQCTVSWGHVAGEIVWSRGIQFLIREKDGSVVNGSFRCLANP
ncbi:hypothetical protein KAR10_08365 [bacterium]|nr:hypothetical protein [bacterium]